MSKNTKIVIGILIVGVIAVLAIGYLASGRRAAQTVATTGTVIDATHEKVRRKNDTIVTITYRKGDTPGQGRDRVRGDHVADYPNGRQVRICYDPNDLTSLRMDDGPCG